MKRTSLILTPILLVALLLCSCNADAQDGIFSAIADSAPDAGIKVQAYLGSLGDAHYVLTDTGVYTIGDSTGFSAILSTSEAQIKNACLSINGSLNYIYVMISKQGSVDGTDSKLLRYNIDGTRDTTQLEPPTNVKWLTTNGVYYTETSTAKTLRFLTATPSVDFTANRIVSKHVSENYILTEHEDGTLKVYYIYGLSDAEKASVSKSSISGQVVGFQVIDDSNFLIVVKNSSTYDIYSLSSTEVKDTGVNLSSTPENGTIHSFHYTDDGKDYVAFKAAQYFDLLTIENSKYSISTISTAGYATKLRTASVSNIVPSNTTGKFIVATWNNSIWEIDPTSTADPVEIK